MDISNLYITIAGIVVATILSGFIARHYFKKSLIKRIEIYFQYLVSAFGGVDKDIVENTEFIFHDEKVDNLFILQFAISNQGSKAVKEAIKPLCIRFPSSIKIIDAKIVYTEPEEREITLSSTINEKDENVLEFGIQVLNSKEGFIVRVIFEGEFDPTEAKFSIVDEDLPPTIHPIGWGTNIYGVTPSVNLGEYLFYLIMIGTGVSTGFLITNYIINNPHVFPIPWDTFKLEWGFLAIVLNTILAGILIFFGGIKIILGQDHRPFHSPSSRMKIPRHLEKPKWIESDPFGRYPESHSDYYYFKKGEFQTPDSEK